MRSMRSSWSFLYLFSTFYDKVLVGNLMQKMDKKGDRLWDLQSHQKLIVLRSL